MYVNRFSLLLLLKILAFQATLKFEYDNSSCICMSIDLRALNVIF